MGVVLSPKKEFFYVTAKKKKEVDLLTGHVKIHTTASHESKIGDTLDFTILLRVNFEESQRFLFGEVAESLG